MAIVCQVVAKFAWAPKGPDAALSVSPMLSRLHYSLYTRRFHLENCEVYIQVFFLIFFLDDLVSSGTVTIKLVNELAGLFFLYTKLDFTI